MPFRFRVGQEVEYTPPGGKNAGLYKIVRQMPEEQQAVDLKYCIKSETEPFERNVLECQLSANVSAGSTYAVSKARLPVGSRAL
jgi:hypothetical protein